MKTHVLNWFYDILPPDIQEIIWKMIEKERRSCLMTVISTIPLLEYCEHCEPYYSEENTAGGKFNIVIEVNKQGYSNGCLKLWRVVVHYNTMIEQIHTVNIHGQKMLVQENKKYSYKFNSGGHSLYKFRDVTNSIFTWHGSTYQSGERRATRFKFKNECEDCVLFDVQFGFKNTGNSAALRLGIAGWCVDNTWGALQECCRKNGLLITGNKTDLVRRLWAMDS